MLFGIRCQQNTIALQEINSWYRIFEGTTELTRAGSNQEGEGKILISTMSIRGSVNWRGIPIDRKVHGGVRAAWFIYFLTVVVNVVNVPNLLNMVTYLHGTMHMRVSSSATTVTNVLGATSGFALIGAFLSDSYITRSRTILLFGPLEFLVLVVAFRNRSLEVPEKLEEAQESSPEPGSIEVPPETNSLKFLDKACINRGKDGGWWLCSTTKVEETKIVLRVLPLFVSSMIGYVSNPILLTFTVQQGGMTNTRLGKIRVSPATLFIIPTIFQKVMLPIYDQFLVPFLRKRTGYVSGITYLQRVGIGFASIILASIISAVVERKRKEDAVQMSLFWLTPQFFLLGVSDVTSFPGLLEFFNSEAPRGMKSIAAALFWCVLGLSSLLATFLVK
ncbi:hypothetical protein BS78_06G143600 [Paspalum vaginatum]|nr:hypothetical protein BS78_06G143600 [Paspalum vaginatum]